MEIKKYSGNPVLTSTDLKFKVNSIFNAGAIKFKDDYLLVCRIEMPNGRSSFILARSKDGYNFSLDDKPCLTPEDHDEFYKYVEWGIEDTRITELDGKFYLTYTGYSSNMPLVILAETEDFKEFKIHGPITEPSNKDAALFPEKINGFYWKMDRPSAEDSCDMWINKSPDLIHWGGYQILARKSPGSWEANKIGGSTPPIRTNAGWLFLYHGVRSFGANLYKVGAMLLDINDPSIEIGRTEEPILQPEHNFERVGDVGNVVFTNGWIVEPNGDIKIYYSGADTNICVAETSIDYLLSIIKTKKG